MKQPMIIISLCYLLSGLPTLGQGTFVYDQQSSTDETPIANAGVAIQQASPYGQSFTPSLSLVDFVRLNLNDYNPLNGLGASLYVNLRSNSISGPILSTSPLVTLPNGFAGPVNFLFIGGVTVTPAASYTFQVIVQSGDVWNAFAAELNYANGTAFYQGNAAPGSDLWFREGIIVPEPSTPALMSIAVLIASLLRRRRTHL